MKNINKKLAAALIIVTAGSVFYGTEKAQAKGLELEGIEITLGRHHGYDAPPPPPPPPPRPRYHAHMPPPPPPNVHHFYGGPGPREPRHEARYENFEPHGRGHMPPPHR